MSLQRKKTLTCNKIKNLVISFPQLIAFLNIIRTEEENDCSDELRQGDHSIEALEPPQSRAVLLSPPLIGRHVEMGESHLEDGVGDPILVVLGVKGKYKNVSLPM